MRYDEVVTLNEALAKANEHIARINGNADLKTATWEEQQAAEKAAVTEPPTQA